MRFASCVAAMALLTAVCAQAQAPASAKRLKAEQLRQMLADWEYWSTQARRYERISIRARQLYPDRRNTPLRELNISDEEVREVEAISKKYLPRALVNISPVVTRCPCEEGPACTAQVYVLATNQDKTRGLQLSRINDRWGVGIVQQWWLRREAVVRQKTGNPTLDEYFHEKAVNELLEEFPICVGNMAAADPAKK